MNSLPIAPKTHQENIVWAKENATSPIAAYLVEGLCLCAATNDAHALWEPFALQYLNACDRTEAPALAISKSRQIGFSFVLGMEAVARAKLYPKSLTNFVSINKDEAEEKIRYARQVNSCLYPEFRLKWRTDNRGELEASNGSRIISHACTPPRGKPKAHHRLDEIAHYQRPKEIYDAAVPAMLRGGSIVIGSSPWVRGGFHYTVMEEQETYKRFERLYIPWWEVLGFCTDIAQARLLAPTMTTHERVALFGTERLQLLCDSMTLDSFQVECELAYADDSMAWITWEEITACTTADETGCVIVTGLDDVLLATSGLLARQYRGEVFAGYDVARKHDLAALTLCELVNGVLKCFAVLVLPDCKFDDQKTVLKTLTPIIERGCIDATGMGANIAEDMHGFDSLWTGITMTAPSKAQLATDMRKQFQDRAISIPPDRDLQRDIHSVQRIITASNNMVFDADRDEHGHADRFWALALTINAAIRQSYTFEVYSVGQGLQHHHEDPLLANNMQNIRPDNSEPPGIDQSGNVISPEELRRLRRQSRR